MASLTQTAILTRKTIRYSVYLVVIVISIRMLFGLASTVYQYFFPPPAPAPTISFGKLPAIPFPEKLTPTGLTYTLETPEGSLPSFSEQVNVYYMTPPTSNLLALDVTKEKATSLGFADTGEMLSQTNYKFTHPKLNKQLVIDIISGAFSISYDLKSDSSPLEGRPTPPEVATADVRSYLSSADLLPEDLTGRSEYEYFKIEAGNLISALSLSEADLVKINIFRQDYNEIPSVSPDPARANVWFLVTGNRESGKKFIGAEYHYFPVDEDQSSTYPIKTSLQAWEELVNGNSFIAQYNPQEATNIIIRRVYLAYYDAGLPIEFYQPVIVFEGDNDFVAYVPAISQEYYGD